MQPVTELTARDISANRQASKWTRQELVGRVLWRLAHPLFAWSPRPFWGWRRLLLRLFGARIGREVHVHPSVRITIPWNISIGDRVTISQGAHLCAGTHDHRDPAMPLLKPPISIERDAWICAEAFVGPGVRIGAHAIIGARCVVMKDVAPGMTMVGNPARAIGHRSERKNSAKSADA